MLLNSEFNFEKFKSFCYLRDVMEASGAELAVRSSKHGHTHRVTHTVTHTQSDTQ